MPTPVVISGGQAVRVAPSPYAALREAVTEVTRALEDQTWTNLASTAGENRGDAPHGERKALIERSRLFCRRSPLAKQSVKLLQNYVLGQGVTIRANDKKQVARIVDEFWEDPVNAAVFTSHDAMSDALRTIYTDGDLFLVLFPDKDTGSLQLGILDALFVEDIVSDPNNWKVAKWYKVNRPVGHYDFATGQWIPEGTAEEFVWYRDWRNDDEIEVPPVTGKRKRGKSNGRGSKAPVRVEEGLVYHVAINRRGLFGEPEPAAALDWLKAHKDFMENRATINAAAATIAWRKKQKGSVGSVQVAAEQLRSRLTASASGWDSNPPPAAGSTIVENENSTMEWVQTNTGAANALADERILRMMVGSAFGGIPNHIFGDEAAANLATATAMNTPMQRMYAQWQKLLGDVIDDLLGFLLDCQHEAGNIGPRDDSKKYGGDERHDNPAGVLDKPQATAEPRRPGIPAPTPPQLGAGGPYRPRVREAMSPIYDQDGYVVGFVEHGSPNQADYYTKYHPERAPRHPGSGGHEEGPPTTPGKTAPGPPDPNDERYQSTDKRYILDDGSWRPDRKKLHEEYVRKAQEGAEVTDEPIVYMTGGGAGSGKSTFLKEADKYDIQTEGVAYVNADKAKAQLPEYNALIAEGSHEAAAVVHEESSHMSKVALEMSLRNKHTVIYDAVGDSGIDSLDGKVKQMRDWGASKVYADYMSIPVGVALARAEWRALNSKDPEERGRRIRPSIIKAAYADIPHTVTAAIRRDTFDRLRVWDNDVPMGSPPILMATYERGKGLEIADEVRWEGFSATPSRYIEPREHGDPSRPNYRQQHPGGGTGKAIPRAQIDFVVDRFHVSTPDTEIEADIRRRIEGKPDWTPADIDDAIRYALKRHHGNRDTYKSFQFEPRGLREHGDPTRGSDYRAKYHPGTGALQLNTGGDWFEAPADGGLGQVVPSDAPASPVEEAAATLRRKQQDFNREGGRIHEVKSMADGVAIDMRIHDMAAAMPPGWFDDMGTKFTRKALDSRRYGNHVLVAYDGDGISGALSWMDTGSDLGLEVLGSTGITDGTGSALTAAILRMAAAQGKGVRLDPLGTALSFWTTVGMHAIPSRDAMFPKPMYGLTRDEVADLAGRLTDA